MTREEQIDKIINSVEEEFTKVEIPVVDKLTIFAKVQNALYKCAEIGQEKVDWIPVSERLPESPYGCLVTVMDTNPMTCDEFENIYPDFVGWDGETWNDADGYSIPFEVIAWQPLPEPYKAESEVTKW